MFLIENVFPFKNGLLVQGHFQVVGAKLEPGSHFEARREGERIGLVRFNKILTANFTHNPTNPRYHLSISFDGNYQKLYGATLFPIGQNNEQTGN